MKSRPIALNLLRRDIPYRRDSFNAGLENAGFVLGDESHKPRPEDLLVIWNRYGYNHILARNYEAANAKVIVVENGYLGKNWMENEWFAMSLWRHNGAGHWPTGGPERWDSLNVEMVPWRLDGEEVLLLPQRGIGEPGVRMEREWVDQTMRQFPSARIRNHPGLDKNVIPIEQDLRNAKLAITWGSGAAIKALLQGVPVLYGLRTWIGAPAAAPIGHAVVRPDRLPMFQRLAWAQWNLQEIQNGTAFSKLCELS